MDLFRINKKRKIEIKKNQKYLNFGCGRDIRQGWVNCDMQKHPNIDKTFNFETYPYPFKANSFDYILLDNVLEHMVHPLNVLDELHRISKNGTLIKIIVPYFNCAGAYNDITHYHYFNRRTFEVMFSQNSCYDLNKEKKFKIHTLKLEPTLIGKFIPSFMRELISMFIGTIIGSIDCEIKVLKKN